MPYIDPKARDAAKVKPVTVGELNFVISSILDDFLCSYGLNYTNLNAMIGVLECAKLELYRRLAAPYEDIKKVQNGDVYKTQVPGFVSDRRGPQRRKSGAWRGYCDRRAVREEDGSVTGFVDRRKS